MYSLNNVTQPTSLANVFMRQTDSMKDGWTQTERPSDRQMDKEKTDRGVDRKTDRETNGQADRLIGRHWATQRVMRQ